MIRETEEFPWDLKLASEKGYPKVMDRAMYFCLYDDMECHNHLIGYTTAVKVAEGIYMVGNTYVYEEYRGENHHRDLLVWRNDFIRDRFGAKTIYTMLNPLPGVHMAQLRRVVSGLGYSPARIRDMRKDGVGLIVRMQTAASRLELWRKDL